MTTRRGLDFEYAIKKDVRNNPIVREIDEERQRQLWRTAGISAVLVLVLVRAFVGITTSSVVSVRFTTWSGARP